MYHTRIKYGIYLLCIYAYSIYIPDIVAGGDSGKPVIYSDYEPVCNMTYKWVSISNLTITDGTGTVTLLPTVVSDIVKESKLIQELSCESHGPCKGINDSFVSYCATVRTKANVVISENRRVSNIVADIGVGCQCMIKKKED
ncbi:NGF [Turkeypox virus]|uniref:NGF n=1 Tax=Turkeypox virus TaxID=336486 RepID=A0A0M3ZRP6_9POXV|nr:NGF [Turkeypox virus]ALA62459.1 NGF [Turkeypox virus]